MEKIDKIFVWFIGTAFLFLIFIIALSVITTHLETMAAIEAGLVQTYDPEHDQLIWAMPRMIWIMPQKEPGDAQADAE